MPKKTPDYDKVFKTMKFKHKKLFIPVINNIFGKHIPWIPLYRRFPPKAI